MKTIKLTNKQASDLLATNPEFRTTILSEFTDNDLGISKHPKDWYDIESIQGYFINAGSYINETRVSLNTLPDARNTFPSREDAEKSLAEAQLKQLAKVMNDNETEEEWVDWKDESQTKYCVTCFDKGGILVRGQNNISNCGYVYFKRKEDRDFSREFHKELWLKYFKAGDEWLILQSVLQKSAT